MIHKFADDHQQWFNTYEVVGMAGICPVRSTDGSIKVVAAAEPSVVNPQFLLKYHGISLDYAGYILTDGIRYAYVINGTMVRHCQEPPLNLYCRSLIRKVIREYLDKVEKWPE